MRVRLGSQNRTVLAVVFAVAALLSIIAAAATFSIARGTAEVAAKGADGILAEATLSAAASMRNATAQAQLVVEAAQLDLVTADEVESALDTAEQAIAELRSRTGRLTRDASDPELRYLIERESESVVSVADEAITAIRSGEYTPSLDIIENDLGPAYEAIVATLVEIRNDAFTDMTVDQHDAGRLADAARFLVVLLVPIVVLVAYRNWIRRSQVRHELETELEKEQAISRTKSDFIAHLSHELRKPLTSIYGSALELNDINSSADRDLAAELTKLITEESADLARMVEDILTVAAEDQNQLTINPTTVNPASEVAAALEPFELMGLITDRQVAPAGVHADPRLLRQVISNLVSNAPRHGSPPVMVKGTIVDTNYVIEVIDHGNGIALGDGEEFFARFVHKEDSPLITGTLGLGLSVVQILVTRMGGTINYERADGKTVFAAHLPLTALPR